MTTHPNFPFVIRTPEGMSFQGNVESVSLTLEGGDVQCFADHASMTGSVAFSPVVIGSNGNTETYMVRNGMFLFDNKTGQASLLVLASQKKSEMSMETVKEYHDFIIEKLRSGADLSEFQIKYLEGERLAVEQQLETI